MSEQIFSNARIVLEDRIVEGSVVIRDGKIAAIDEGSSRTGEDFGGDYLIPGLVELHTDHYENHYRPRPGVTWHAMAALQAHDAQIAGAGKLARNQRITRCIGRRQGHAEGGQDGVTSQGGFEALIRKSGSGEAKDGRED